MLDCFPDRCRKQLKWGQGSADRTGKEGGLDHTDTFGIQGNKALINGQAAECTGIINESFK